MKKLNKLLYLSMLLCLALVVYVIESQIPVIFPGIKLGLANSIALFVLLTFGWEDMLLITVLRSFIGSIFGGNLFGFLFSIFGGILSNVVMILLYKYFKKNISIQWLSIAGAIFHNLGQLLVAAFVIKSFRIFVYSPILIGVGIITGYFTGLVCFYVYRRDLLKYFKTYK